MTFNQRPFQLKVDLRKWTIANIVHHRNLQTLSRTTLFRTVSETIEHLEACVFLKNNSLSVLISRLESGNLSLIREGATNHMNPLENLNNSGGLLGIWGGTLSAPAPRP